MHSPQRCWLVALTGLVAFLMYVILHSSCKRVYGRKMSAVICCAVCGDARFFFASLVGCSIKLQWRLLTLPNDKQRNTQNVKKSTFFFCACILTTYRLLAFDLNHGMKKKRHYTTSPIHEEMFNLEGEKEGDSSSINPNDVSNERRKGSSMSEQSSSHVDNNNNDANKRGKEVGRGRWSVPDPNIGSGVLDDGLELKDVGFPPSPLTLRELNFCDRTQKIVLQGWSFHPCKNDQSCSSCARNSALFSSIASASSYFKSRGDGGEGLLRPYYGKVAPNGGRDEGEGAFLQQFIHLVPLQEASIRDWRGVLPDGAKPRVQTIIVAMDEAAEKAATSKGFSALPAYSWFAQLLRDVDEEVARFAVTILLANALLQVGMSVVWTPASMAFHQDERCDHLLYMAYHRDMLLVATKHRSRLRGGEGGVSTDSSSSSVSLASSEGKPSSSSLAEPFFAIVRSNQRTKIFFQTIADALPLLVHSDSTGIFWDEFLRHYKFRQISFRTLPPALLESLVVHKTSTSRS
eukprot:jgi/Bigna1/66157/fgenesh1_pg.1_\